MLEHLNRLLNPALLDTTTRDLADCGKESLKAVVDFYGKTHMIRGTEVPSVIDPDRTKDDFLHFKYFLKSLSTTPFSQVQITLCAQTIFPDFATMTKLLLVSAIASVPCEKGLSQHRTCLRPGYDLLSLKEYWNHLCESVLRAHC